MPGTAKASFQFFGRQNREPVPFELVNNHIFFKAQIEGREVWALLDNRWERSTIDIGLAQAAGLSIDPDKHVARTPTGELTWQRIADVSVLIPGQVQFRAPMAGMDLSAISRMSGRRIEAVLGGNLFGVMGLAVDSGRRTFSLAPTGALKPPNVFTLVPLKNGLPQVEVLIGGKPVLVGLDLGSSAFLSLTPEAWTRVGSKDAKFRSRSGVHADGKPFMVDHARVPEARLGSIFHKDVDVEVRPWPEEFGDGVVGMGFLAASDFVLDVGAGKLWLVPRLPSVAGPGASDEMRQLIDNCANSNGRVLVEVAIESCTKLLQSKDNSAERRSGWFNNRGNAYRAQKDLARAIADYGEAIRINPRYPGALTNRAGIHLAGKSMAQALADLNEALRIDPQFSLALHNRAFIHLLEGRFQDAWTDFDTAAQIQPFNARHLYGRGIAALRMNRESEGRAAMTRATSMDPEVSEYFAARGIKP